MASKKQPTIWIVDSDHPEKKILEKAEHGDMLYNPQDSDRTMGVKFVQALDAKGKALAKKKVVRKDTTGSGYCSVPLDVTRHMDDPVGYYLSHLAVKQGKETLVRKDDWYAIELDGKAHAGLLKQQAGGKAVATGRKVIYFVNDWGAGKSGFYIYNPLTKEEDDSMEGWKPLNAKTPKSYLGKEIYRKTAKEVGKDQSKAAKVFENGFLTYLNAHPGAMVTLRNIPKDINNYEKEGGNMMNGNLVKVEKAAAGSLPDITVKFTEWVEDPKKKEMVPVEHQPAFKPTILAKDGKFGNVHFWVDKSSGWMLFPPYEVTKKLK